MPEEKSLEEQPSEPQPLQSMKFYKCPGCGSEKRIIESMVREEVSKGNMREPLRTSCMTVNTAIFDPGSGIIAPKKVPIVHSYFDICADCGNLYCVEIQVIEGFAQPEIRRDDFRHRPR